MRTFPLCPRCEVRSIDPADALEMFSQKVCNTCRLDDAIRTVLGFVSITPDHWPVERPLYGEAVLRIYHGRVPSHQLSFDEAERAGLDGTGRDGDPRFPYHLSDLTESEKRLLDGNR